MKHLLIFFIIFLCLSVQAQNWTNVGSGANSTITCLYNDTINHKLCIAGEFTQISGVHARGIATLNGTELDSLDVGVNYLYGSPTGIKTMCMYNGDLYVGGVAKMGNYFIHGLAKWNGVTWDTINEHTNGSISCTQVKDGYIYASGFFTTAGSVTANSVARWDGAHWSNIGTGFPYYNGGSTPNIVCMKFYNNDLYVGSSFEDSVGNRMGIAKFNGISWGSAGVSISGTISDVSCMEVYNNELYVAGLFNKVDGNIDNGIIRYDGISWKPVGGGFGVGMQVKQLKVIDNKLYAVGAFYTAGGVAAQKIAAWDGTDWCGLGSIINGIIYAIAEYDNEIYIGGGAIDTIDNMNVPINMLAKWIGGDYVDTCGNLSVGINEQTNIDQNLN